MWDQINGLVVQSTNRIMTGIANFLPGLLALILIVTITLMVAAIVRIALRRFLRGIDFDGIVARWGFPEVAEWSPNRSPSLMATRIVNASGGDVDEPTADTIETE